MRILVREGLDLIHTAEIDSNRVLIGSDSTATIHLPDARVLPVQATLALQDDGAWIIEAAADNQVALLNGRPILKPTSLENSDEVKIFDFTLIISRASNQKQAAPKKAPRTVATREVAELRAHPLPPASVVKHLKDQFRIDGRELVRSTTLPAKLLESPDIARLIDFALDHTLEAFGGRVAFIGVRRNGYGPVEFVQGRNVEGRNVGEPPDMKTFIYRCLEQDQFICVPDARSEHLSTTMAVPLCCNRGILGLVYIDRKPNADPFSLDDLDHFSLFATQAAARLETIVTSQQGLQEAVDTERLSFLREVQTRMDPTTAPQWDGLQMAVYCKPGDRSGGDVFDVMRLPNGLAACLIAHVSGEPTRAAMAMVEVRAAFRNAGLHADPPHIFFRAFNWFLSEERVPCKLDAAMLVMNPKSGAMEFCTAGNVGVVVVDSRGEPRELFMADSPAIGEQKAANYTPGRDRVAPGETLALFTRGCLAVTDADGASLGRERFVDSLCDGFGQSAAVALDELIADHGAFFKGGTQPDDISILVFHRVSAPA